MITLGIETSCDETGLALIEDGRLLAETLSTQEEIHNLFGGVVPEIAAREHLKTINRQFQVLLERAECPAQKIDVVAVTRGPGLLGCLLVGMGLAKGIVLGVKAKLIGVNHLQAHVLAVGLEEEIIFPALGLLTSGGHTNTFFLPSPTELQPLGRTLDDSCGEILDKTAKMLNLPYPGGKYIDILAEGREPNEKLFPRPYLDNQNLDFSFSGLKTAVAVYLQKNPHLRLPVLPSDRELDLLKGSKELGQVCSSLLWAVNGALRIKTERALKASKKAKSLILCGGVAKSPFLRQVMADLAAKKGLRFHVPSPFLCADNGAMIAFTGETLAKAGLFHNLNLDAVPRGRPVPWDYVSRF